MYFAESGVEELAQSPELNPTEHFWDEFGSVPDPITQHQYLTSLMLNSEWEQIPPAMFLHLVESFPRRIAAVKCSASTFC